MDRKGSRKRTFWAPGVAAVVLAGGALSWLSVQSRESQQRPAWLHRAKPPNVLLVSIDTLRADHLGPYGAKVKTPALDELARRGVVFEYAVSHVPITLPAHASMLTGTYPVGHGVHDNGSFRLGEDHETVAEMLRAAGYGTAAFVGSFALDSRFGLDQGFEHYDDFYGDTGSFDDFGISERPADDVLEPALRWLRERRDDEKWFAFVHLYDPHAPYSPPPSFREAHPQDPYTGEVAYVDDALGRFLGALREEGRLENTLVVFTADHGEGLGEHGEKTHGMFAYDSTLRIPLIVAWEGVLPEGLRVSPRVRLIDLAPTIAELTSTSGPGFQGETLTSLISNPDRGADRESYFEALAFNLNRNWAPLTGIYRGPRKYIRLPIAELYHLEADPGESRNLFPSSPERAAEMSAALDDLVGAYSAEQSAAGSSTEIDEETIARLRSLGYLVAPRRAEAARDYGPEDDPKNLIHLSDKLDAGVAAQLAGRSEEAIRLFREILAERPSFSNAYANLAQVLGDSGRPAEAIEVLEGALERGVHTRTMLARLGFYLQEAGRLEDSVRVLESVIEEDPGYAEAYNYLGVSYARLGRTEEALKALERLLELDESYASAYSNIGSVHLARKDPQRAIAQFEKALEIDPGLASAWNGLGVALVSSGREEEALQAWERSVSLDPRQYETLYNLGTLLTQLNRFERAIPYLEQFVRSAPPELYGDDIPKVRRLIAALKSQTS